jgi:hypothetical protein
MKFLMALAKLFKSRCILAKAAGQNNFSPRAKAPGLLIANQTA